MDNLKLFNLYSLLVLELKMINQNTVNNAPFTFIKVTHLPHIVTYSEFKIKPESKVFDFKRSNDSVKIMIDCTASEKMKVLVKIILPHCLYYTV